MIKSAIFRKYFLPGFVFQSILIGGGYGTGRELVEFFLNYGPLGGLLAMLLISTVIWCAVFTVTFELARATRAYDYRNFMRQLLGRAWGLYEVCYLVSLPLVLAVIAAAAGSILEGTFMLPYYAGVIGMMVCIGFLVFKGTSTIEELLSMWSFVLYAVYIALFLWSLSRYGGEILSNLSSKEMLPGWFMGGVKYAAYNLGAVPAILFSLRHVETRKEAIGAGLLAAPIGILPGVFFYLSMVGQYPGILDQAVPANYLLGILGSKAFLFTYQVVLLGTLVETGTGLIHAFNERVAAEFVERKLTMPSFLRPAVALLLMVAASLFARFGLIDLIAKGYGTIAWGFLLVFVIPVLTLGLRKILQTQEHR